MECYKDIAGDISDLKYGGGHTKKEYNESYGHGEAFAQTFSAYIRRDQIFKLEFPKQWEYIENMMKGLK